MTENAESTEAYLLPLRVEEPLGVMAGSALAVSLCYVDLFFAGVKRTGG